MTYRVGTAPAKRPLEQPKSMPETFSNLGKDLGRHEMSRALIIDVRLSQAGSNQLKN